MTFDDVSIGEAFSINDKNYIKREAWAATPQGGGNFFIRPRGTDKVDPAVPFERTLQNLDQS